MTRAQRIHGLYDLPEYYEIPFTFRDIAAEVRFLQRAAARFSKVRVRRVLELACGTAPYLEEWHRRGVGYVGIDNSAAMVRFARDKAQGLGAQAEIIRANMNSFMLGRKVDLAYVLLGSLYVESNATFLAHLDCVGDALRHGGLYMLDGVVNFKLLQDRNEKWTIRRGRLTARTIYELELIDPFAQLCQEHLTVHITERGRRKLFASKLRRKLFYPQELALLITRQGAFEVVGWYKNFRLSGPSDAKGRHQVILRRR